MTAELTVPAGRKSLGSVRNRRDSISGLSLWRKKEDELCSLSGTSTAAALRP